MNMHHISIIKLSMLWDFPDKEFKKNVNPLTFYSSVKMLKSGDKRNIHIRTVRNVVKKMKSYSCNILASFYSD